MKIRIMSFFALALTVMPAFAQVTSQPPAQSNCMLTVREIRLGMSLQQLLALFPASSKRKEIRDAIDRAKATTSNETVYLLFEATKDGSRERFAGIDTVLVGIYKGQVVDFTVLYIGITWKTVDEWIEKLREGFGLPSAQGWVVGPNENPTKILKCKEVEIEAGIQGGSGTIRVRNTENKAMEERKDVGEEKKREFKP